ncbi:MAG: winged helix-turn-helix domain-containing protein [Planctomycetota bacterium]
MGKEGKDIKAKCKNFELDLTDYVMGDTTFLTRKKQEKLFEHLGTCQECRRQFWSWKRAWAVMVGKKQSERPEFRQKMDALLERLKSSCTERSECAQVKTNTRDARCEITSAAGQVYALVKAKGRMSVPAIRKQTGLVGYPFYEAVGCLVIDKKVVLNKDNKTAYDSLQPVQ